MKKKVLAIFLAAAMMFALVIPAMAAPAPKVEPTELTWTDGFGFHCNACGGNGQTTVTYTGNDPAVIKAIGNIKKQPAGSLDVLKGDQKDIFGTKTYPIMLERVGTTTEWNLITGDDIVCATCGRTDWVTYSNQNGVINGKNIQAHHPVLPEPPPEDSGDIYGTFSLAKTIDGGLAGDWEIVKGNDIITIFDVFEYISFKLYKAAGNNGAIDYSEVIGFGELDIMGDITFRDLPDDLDLGWYALVEYFTPGSLAEEIFEDVGPKYIEIVDKVLNGSEVEYIIGGVVDSFDKAANYYVDMAKVGESGSVILETKYAGDDNFYKYINRDGNPNAVYNITVRNAEGDSFLSYCGSHSSQNFFDGAYTEGLLPQAKKDAIIQALNFIWDRYGSIDAWSEWGWDLASVDGAAPGYIRPITSENSTYVISQIVVWMILHEDEIDNIDAVTNNNNVMFDTSGGIGNYALIPGSAKDWLDEYGPEVNAAVSLVLAGYKSFSGEKKVTDVAFLTAAASMEGYSGDGSVGSYYFQPQLIPIFGGDNNFNNKTRDDEEFFGGLSFEKKVDGMNITDWLESKGLSPSIFLDLIFTLDGVGDDGVTRSYVGECDLSGSVTFVKVAPGVYTLSEEVTGDAVGIFRKMADIENITIGKDDEQFFVLGGTVKGNVEGVDIKDDDLFTIINGYGGGTTLNYGANSEYLNNNGDLFYIGVTNTRTKAVFDSFCAYAGAKWFAGDGSGAGVGYMVAESMEDLKYLQAFNYIVDNYCGEGFGDFSAVSSARQIAQVVVWALLGQIDVNTTLFKNTTLTEIEKDAVKATLENYAGYVGSGSVVDVLYMTGVDVNGNKLPEESYVNAQPQIVPIFGTFYVENEPEGDEDFYGSVEIALEISAQHEKVTYEPTYKPETMKNNTDTLVSKSNHGFGTLNGHQVYVVVGDGGTFEIADSSPNNIGIGYYYDVTIEDGKMYITFNDVVKANIGVWAVNDRSLLTNGHPNGKEGNSAVKTLNDESYTFVLDAADYLFVHIAGGIEWATGNMIFDGWIVASRETIPDMYDGEIALVIEGPNGFYYALTCLYSEFTLLIDLPPEVPAGDYTATLSGADFTTQIKSVTVPDNGTGKFEFDPITVTGDLEEVYPEL